jgi:phosphatidylglycerophosphatase A
MPEAASVVPVARRLSVACATMFGVGLLKPAPGTWGTAVAALIALPFLMFWPVTSLTLALITGVVMTTAVGLMSASGASRHFGSGDPSSVVIDEVAGTWLALVCIPAHTLVTSPWLSLVAVVVLFRVFDIAKPWPVSWFERLPGGFGIMADDLAAGAVAGIIATAWLH